MFGHSPSGLRCYLHFNLFGSYYIPLLLSVAVIQTDFSQTNVSIGVLRVFSLGYFGFHLEIVLYTNAAL